MDTVRIKHKDDDGNEYQVINASDYDPKKHKLYDDKSADPTANMSEDEKKMLAEDNARRKVQGNRGIEGGGATIAGSDRNPSGTYSEPTPTDIRYPNKDHTEFENNHGAFVSKSAAEMRQAAGMPDEPGGLNPAKKKAVDAKAAEDQAAADKLKAGDDELPSSGKTNEELDGMTVAELKSYAEERGIDLDGAVHKADILKKIKKA